MRTEPKVKRKQKNETSKAKSAKVIHKSLGSTKLSYHAREHYIVGGRVGYNLMVEYFLMSRLDTDTVPMLDIHMYSVPLFRFSNA